LKFWDYAGLKMGETGVLLFFVLSGFLITRLLRNEAGRTGTISLGHFYLRRARRLLPALAVFLAALALLRAAGLLPDLPDRDFAAAILYVRNIFGRSRATEHLWSLSLEEQFYTLWPLLFLWLGRKRMLPFAVGLTLAVTVWRGVSIGLGLWDYESGLFYLRPWFRFDAIAIGCWLALARLPECPAWVFAVSVSALAGWTLFGEGVSHAFFITLQTLLTAVFFFSVVRGGPAVKRLFAAGWLRWLGGISYSLYLWQQLFLVALPTTLWVRHFPWNILVSIALAVLSKQYIERPFLEMRRSGPAVQPPLGLASTASSLN
jgi:peptidoglycan/LPS O-acetylase OafA/YrhL